MSIFCSRGTPSSNPESIDLQQVRVHPVSQHWRTAPTHKVEYESQLASRNYIQGLMWCKFGHVTVDVFVLTKPLWPTVWLCSSGQYCGERVCREKCEGVWPQDLLVQSCVAEVLVLVLGRFPLRERELLLPQGGVRGCRWGRIPGCYVANFAPHKALKLIA